MYRERDTYLINCHMDLSDSADACRAISDKFAADSVPFLNERASLQNSILFFAYMCQYITYEELSIFLGAYFSGAAVRAGVSTLIKKKLVRKETFSEPEGQSRNAFCLTKHGINTILPLLPYSLPHNVRPRRSGRIVPLHDYYCGVNMMHLFVSPLSYLWKKEEVFANKLRPDIVLSMRTKEVPRHIYIEQDMGTEDKEILLEKLNQYDALGLTTDSMVIYSMSIKLTQPNTFSGLQRGFVKDLITVMEKCHIKSVYRLYEAYLRCNEDVISAAGALKHSEDFLYRLEEFLVWTGVCRSMGTPASSMSRKNLNRYANHDFTLKEVKRYLSELETSLNPYINMYINRTAATYSFHKYCAILEMLFFYISHASWGEMPYINTMLGGFPTYVVPTLLLSNYFPYMFPSVYGTVDRYVASLLPYYPTIKDSDFAAVRERLFVRKNFPAISFRDSFLVNGGLVIITTVYNMSALSQAMLLYNIRYQENYKFIHFIFLVDEYEQAVRIHQLLKAETCKCEDSYFPQASFLSCAYLLHRECGRPERLFSIYEYEAFGRTAYEPIYLYPKAYDNGDGELHTAIMQKKHSHFYDIPGYGDILGSLADDIAEESEDDEDDD